MKKKIKQWLDPSIYGDNEENKVQARILSLLICASWGTLLLVLITTLFYNDWKSVGVILISSALLIAPYALLRRGYLAVSSLIVVLMMISTITLIATVGQGILDMAIIAFPIVFIFAGLTLKPVHFRISVGVTFAAIGWLAFGEDFGLFSTSPLDWPNWLYFTMVAVILFVAAMAVELMAIGMRKSLKLALQEIEQRKILETQLRFQSTHDILTGLYNRTFFTEEMSRLEKGREFPISIIVVDVDDLKKVNDAQGHGVGDEMLRRVVKVLSASFRTGDVLARIGGDEFAALLPKTNASTVTQIVDRTLIKMVEQNKKLPDLPVHFSIGAATAVQGKLEEAFVIADQRMYANKAAYKAMLQIKEG